MASALAALAREKKFDASKAEKAFEELGVKSEKPDPARPRGRWPFNVEVQTILG